MRLRQVGLKSLENCDRFNLIEGVSVWLPYGWFARLLLERVTGSEFGQLVDLVKRNANIRFAPGYEQYDYRNEVVQIEIYDREYIDGFVRRGAFHDPRVMLELGRNLFQKLEDSL